MRIFQTITSLREFLKEYRKTDQSIGLVPTMGALHRGHGELIRSSLASNNITVCSVFVNPTQFNDPSDLTNYPRNFEKDVKFMEELGVDAVFHPSEQEMYPTLPTIGFDFGSIDKVLEGEFREGHFKGVGIVVSKLLNIVQPDNAYFGQKDFQQVMIIEKLANDLSFPVNIIRVPTVREEDGLAFSSRNQILTIEDRERAPVLYEALISAKKKISEGQKLSDVKLMVQNLCNDSQARLEYFEAVDSANMKLLESVNVSEGIFLCIAASFGNVRLIDNISLFD